MPALRGRAEERYRSGSQPTKTGKFRKMQTNAPVAVAGVITWGRGAQELVKGAGPDLEDRLYRAVSEAVAACYGEGVEVLGLVVHADEASPHGHFWLDARTPSGTPLSKRGVSGSDLQDAAAAAASAILPGIERGQRRERPRRYRTPERMRATLAEDMAAAAATLTARQQASAALDSEIAARREALEATERTTARSKARRAKAVRRARAGQTSRRRRKRQAEAQLVALDEQIAARRAEKSALDFDIAARRAEAEDAERRKETAELDEQIAFTHTEDLQRRNAEANAKYRRLQAECDLVDAYARAQDAIARRQATPGVQPTASAEEWSERLDPGSLGWTQPVWSRLREFAERVARVAKGLSWQHWFARADTLEEENAGLRKRIEELPSSEDLEAMRSRAGEAERTARTLRGQLQELKKRHEPDAGPSFGF